MREVFGDIWETAEREKVEVVCVTTNGDVNRRGEAVMGRGVALQAAQRYPWLKRVHAMNLRGDLEELVHLVHVPFAAQTGEYPRELLMLPVKHHFYEDADPSLVANSLESLRQIANATPRMTFLLPRPGVGNGRLSWEDVKPLCEPLPDNVWVIDRFEQPSTKEESQNGATPNRSYAQSQGTHGSDDVGQPSLPL